MVRTRASEMRARTAELLCYIAEADARLAPLLDRAKLEAILAAVPDDWLAPEADFPTPAHLRAAYVDYLLRRLEAPRPFVEEADRARG